MFKRPPLQFIGNKYRFREQYIEQITKFNNPNYIFVDLFGGSGYLSHITKHVHPDNEVIYNDFDGYKERVERIEKTNKIINEIKAKFEENNVEYGAKASRELSDEIALMLKQKEDNGEYIDWRTLSSQLCFTTWICQNYEKMKGCFLYNKLHKREIITKDYFNGLRIIKDDWKNIYNNFKDNKNIVWIIDPPYPLTTQTQFASEIDMKEVCAVIDIMFAQPRVVYFCSNTSGVEDMIVWKYNNKFNELYDKYSRINYAGGRAQKSYTDLMFVSKEK